MATNFRQYPTRAEKVGRVKINLTATEPFARLREFCHQCHYTYKFSWDKFQNGIMCACEVYYYMNNTRHTLINKAHFLNGTDHQFAQAQLAAIVLDELGLGVEDETPTDDVPQNSAESTTPLAAAIGNAVSALLNNISPSENGSQCNDDDLVDTVNAVLNNETVGAVLRSMAPTDPNKVRVPWADV